MRIYIILIACVYIQQFNFVQLRPYGTVVNTYAVQSGGCRFESLWGFGFFLKGAHYEVDYSGNKTYLAGLQCTLTSSCAKIAKGLQSVKYSLLQYPHEEKNKIPK